MARIKVMKLWTAFITAFLALCTALGLITTSAAAAVPQSEPTVVTGGEAPATVPAMPQWAWAHTKALPPTMKQRIRAEAHGKTPSCRHRPPVDADADDATADATTDATTDAMTDARTGAINEATTGVTTGAINEVTTEVTSATTEATKATADHHCEDTAANPANTATLSTSTQH
ncbi:DUF6344 domain-containing protein [Streptomyces sp. NPDC088387]|uniref:DUF6344 domain-containing protein n=1 Tax=Streptomyces sp. NPDC088387 TaxID=3365859 RepID=UPI0037FA8B6D